MAKIKTISLESLPETTRNVVMILNDNIKMLEERVKQLEKRR